MVIDLERWAARVECPMCGRVIMVPGADGPRALTADLSWDGWGLTGTGDLICPTCEREEDWDL